jgi:hypothetical protein
MINARIQPNLIHNRNPRLLYFLLQLHHRRTNIARRDHILLLPNRKFDDRRMESVWDQADHYIVLLDLSVKSVGVGDIEGDGVGSFDAAAELL